MRSSDVSSDWVGIPSPAQSRPFSMSSTDGAVSLSHP